jgi:general transcription factor 3C polypeptide 3 (transcription factor C subunit 4)
VYRYFDLRVKSGKARWRQEAKFNVGCVWHRLGLVSLALLSYERCIELSEAVRREVEEERRARREDRMEDRDGDEEGEEGAWTHEDPATEAAFALQSIYAVSGNFEAARNVTKDVLVLE